MMGFAFLSFFNYVRTYVRRFQSAFCGANAFVNEHKNLKTAQHENLEMA